jgi:D-alanine-D-alanine ligase
MDKEKTKLLWAQAGLPVVPWVSVTKADGVKSAALLDEAETKFGYPLFVKPANAGSSVGITKVRDRKALEGALTEALLWDDKALVEVAIDAREIECSIIGDGVLEPKAGSGNVTVYAAGEINPKHEFYDYEAKYHDPDGAALLIPAALGEAKLAEIRDIAQKAYTALDCSGLARLDFFIDRKTGKLYLNEINTMPGFTPISMFPKICEVFGLSYPALIETLLDAGVKRFRAKRSLRTSLL